MLRALFGGASLTKEQLKEQAREKFIETQQEKFKKEAKIHAAAQKAKADQRAAERAKELAARAEKLKILEQSHKDSKLVDVKQQEALAKRKADRLNSLANVKEFKAGSHTLATLEVVDEKPDNTRQNRKVQLEQTVYNSKVYSEDSVAMSLASKK